ncbi:MAG: CHAT domain-containing protein [Acidobacteria bacterium]|nr:CHAT domain-containing protein [Acidobacteriota bacterium]
MRSGCRIRLAVLLALALAVSAAARAGEVEAPAFTEAARAAAARGDAKAIAKLVAADRATAYEAADRLLEEGTSDSLALAETIASRYAASYDDAALADRVALFRSFTAAQVERRRLAVARKKEAITALGEGRTADSLAGFESSLVDFRELGDLREEGRCLSNLGAVLAVTGKADEALARLEEAAATSRRAGDRGQLAAIFLNRAYVVGDLGDVRSERSLLTEAIVISRENADAPAEGRALAVLGGLLEKLGEAEPATDALRRSLAVARRIGDAEMESAAWFNLAGIREKQGDFAGTVRFIRRSIDAAHRGGLTQAEADSRLRLVTLARGQGDYATATREVAEARAVIATTDDSILRSGADDEEAILLSSMGEYERSLPLFASAESLLEGTDASGQLSSILGGRAVSLYYLGRYTEAEESLTRAIALAAAAARPDLEATQRMSLGVLVSALGEGARGLGEFEKAAGIYRTTGDLVGLAEVLDGVGNLRFRSGDLTGAREELEEAVAAFPPEASPLQRAEARKDLALVEFASGPARRDAGRARLKEALDGFTALDDLLGVVHCGLIEVEEDLGIAAPAAARAALERTSRFARGRRTTEFGWQTELMEGRVLEAEKKPAAAAKAYARSIAEVEELRAGVRAAPWRAAILDDRIAPYRALSRLDAESGDAEKGYRIARAAKARGFTDRLEFPAWEPAASTAAATEPPVTTAGVPSAAFRRLLGPDEAVLDFFYDDAGLGLYVARRDGVVFRRVASRDTSIDPLVEAVRYPGRPAAAGSAVAESWSRAAARLGERIFVPIAADLDGIDHLFIVPNGPLHAVPFAAIGAPGGRAIDRFTLTVLPAAEALLSRGRSPREGFARTLALGDPATPESSRLPGAAEEARAVAASAGRLGDLLLGVEARESAVKKRGGAYGVLHVAAHARIDPIQPARSALLLAPGDGDDGRLEAGEIAAIPISASLVVLSGCGAAAEGGLAHGRTAGDELDGLARAFLTAGAGTVIAGLWEADDRASRRIVPRLFELLAEHPPELAVRLVQSEMIAGRLVDSDGARFDHPFYWAGLAAYGAGTPTVPGSARASARGDGSVEPARR